MRFMAGAQRRGLPMRFQRDSSPPRVPGREGIPSRKSQRLAQPVKRRKHCSPANRRFFTPVDLDWDGGASQHSAVVTLSN
jgi:hypothetical protein